MCIDIWIKYIIIVSSPIRTTLGRCWHFQMILYDGQFRQLDVNPFPCLFYFLFTFSHSFAFCSFVTYTNALRTRIERVHVVWLCVSAGLLPAVVIVCHWQNPILWTKYHRIARSLIPPVPLTPNCMHSVCAQVNPAQEIGIGRESTRAQFKWKLLANAEPNKNIQPK